MSEDSALDDFLCFLETLGGNIVLVCADEDTVGILIEKLKARNKTKYCRLVAGYSWWRRVLKYLDIPGYCNIEREDFHRAHSPTAATQRLHSAKVVAGMLSSSVDKNKRLTKALDEKCKKCKI